MHKAALFLVLPLFLVSTALAQSGQPGANEIDFETAKLSRIAYALPTEEPISIDGRLDEEAWQRAEPIGDFVQWGNSWDPGGPASSYCQKWCLGD